MITLKWTKVSPTAPWSTNFHGFYIELLTPRSFRVNETFTYNGRLDNLISRLASQ